MKILISIFILLIVAVAGFFWWASSPSLSPEAWVRNTVNDKAEQRPVTDGEYSIITYNIGYLSGMDNNLPVKLSASEHQKHLAAVVQNFKLLRPHLVAYQEIDYNSDRSFDLNQSEVVARQSGFRYMADAVNWDKRYVPFPYWPPSVHYGKIISGQSLHSDWPVLSHEVMRLEPPSSPPFYHRAFYTERLAQVCKVAFPEGEVMVINVHLEAYDVATRLRQAQVVEELYKKYSASHPVLLVGDFNSPAPTKAIRESPNYEALVDDLLHLPDIASAVPPEEFGQPVHFTFSSGQPQEQIDYIFYTPSRIEKLEARVVGEIGQASDHLPLMMRFRLKSGLPKSSNE